MEFLNITKKEDYAIVQFDRGKANVLNHQMVKEIRQAFKELDADDTVRGLILTGKPHFFSAGLDLIELYGYDQEKIKAFFFDFSSMFIDLMKFSKPSISAITGHSPAGGCVIAITCDSRIMAEGEKYTIGLNEVAVNILISENIPHAYAFWIGRRKAYQYILEGKLLSVQEAYDSGLVDEICPLEEVLERAERKMQKWLKADDDILRGTKYNLRKDLIKKIDLDVNTLVDVNKSIWWKPEIRAAMKQFVDFMLAKKKQKVG